MGAPHDKAPTKKSAFQVSHSHQGMDEFFQTDNEDRGAFDNLAHGKYSFQLPSDKTQKSHLE